MTGLQIGCLYSYGCRMARKTGVQDTLLAFIKGKKISEQDVIRALQQLQSYPAYRLIANSRNRNNVFAKEIVQAYWFGDKFPVSREMRNLNHNFATLEKLILLEGFNTFSIEKVRLILDCSISFGKVLKLNSDRIEVVETGLMFKNGKVVFEERRRKVGVGFVSKRKINKRNIVSIHLGMAREIISGQTLDILQQTTKEALQEHHSNRKKRLN